MTERDSQWPRVAIVVPCWNHEQDTLDCLERLAALDYPNYQVVVVDNGSEESSFRALGLAAHGVTLLRLNANRGFSGGINAGIRWALEQNVNYIWLLNNDAIAFPDALSALVARAESDPTIGAVGSLLYEGDRLICGARLNLWTGCTHHLEERISDAEIDYLIGASLLVRATVWPGIGLLDEGYFLYWEDADFSFRLRRAGWRLTVTDEAIVRHHGSRPLAFADPMRDFHYTCSSLRFLQRYAPVPSIPMTILTTRRLASRLYHRRWQNARAIVRALGHRNESR